MIASWDESTMAEKWANCCSISFRFVISRTIAQLYSAPSNVM